MGLGDLDGPIYRGPGGHKFSFPHMVQDVFERRTDVEHAPQCQEVRSWTNYILGIYQRLLMNVALQDSRHNTDHYLVLGCLRGAPLAKHSHYLANKKRFPLKPPKIREDSTVWEWRSKGEIPIHLGGNISAMYGSHLRPGALSKPGLRHTKAGTVWWKPTCPGKRTTVRQNIPPPWKGNGQRKGIEKQA